MAEPRPPNAVPRLAVLRLDAPSRRGVSRRRRRPLQSTVTRVPVTVPLTCTSRTLSSALY